MSDLGTTSLFYSARPTLTLDGSRDRALEEGLMSLSVEETVEGLAACEASFGNWGTAAGEVGFLYFDRAVLEFGRALVIGMGSGDAAGEVFSGRITGLEGRFPKARPPEILVLAEDRLQDLRMTRRSRTFEDVDLEEVVRTIASNHGLTPEVDLDSPAYPVLAQLNQSDLAFLRERARDADAEVWVQGDRLFAQARSRRGGEEIELTYGQGLHELVVAADLAGQCSSLTVAGWNVAAKDGLTAEAGPSSLVAESRGETGGAVLDATFGARDEHIVHRLPMTSAEAGALAAAEYRRRARRFLRGEAIVEGNGRLRVGAQVALRGCGPLFDGTYTVVTLRHSFDLEAGFRTRLGLERPWIGGT
jgi:uncharacterized protein